MDKTIILLTLLCFVHADPILLNLPLPFRTLPRGFLVWTDSRPLWATPDGSQPSPSDQVEIDLSIIGECANGYFQLSVPENFTVEVDSVQLKSLYTTTESKGCFTALYLAPGSTLIVHDTFVVGSNSFLLLDTGSKVVAEKSFVLTSRGIIQGWGTISSPNTIIHGHVSPGYMMVPRYCRIFPFWDQVVYAEPHSNNRFGTLTFLGSARVVSSTASFWLKINRGSVAAYDVVSFDQVNFGSRVFVYPFFVVEDDATSEIPDGTKPILFNSLTGNVPVLERRKWKQQPWIAWAKKLWDCTRESLCEPGVKCIGPGSALVPPDVPFDQCADSGGISILVVGSSCKATSAPGGVVAPLCASGCSGNGICTITGACVCLSDTAKQFGWTGSNCNVPFCLNQCSGHGSCTGSSSTIPSCNCLPGFSGLDCSVAACPESCNLNGVCDLSSGQAICDCNVGWQGTSCKARVSEGSCADSCGRGKCVNSTCTCTSTWKGNACAVPMCPGTNNCTGGNGYCTGGSSTNFCTCFSGWTGSSCEERVATSSPSVSTTAIPAWAIVVISVGGVALVAVIVVVAVLLRRRYEVRRARNALRDSVLLKETLPSV